jgi:hypothetical protein
MSTQVERRMPPHGLRRQPGQQPLHVREHSTLPRPRAPGPNRGGAPNLPPAPEAPPPPAPQPPPPPSPIPHARSGSLQPSHPDTAPSPDTPPGRSAS